MQIEWNKVTWYSKLLAVIIFILSGVLWFWIGAKYEDAISVIERIELRQQSQQATQNNKNSENPVLLPYTGSKIVFGPVTLNGKPDILQTTSYTFRAPVEKAWLQIETSNLTGPAITNMIIIFNGVQVAGLSDINKMSSSLSKDITLRENNTLNIRVQGEPESTLTVTIRWADKNQTVMNAAGDFIGGNDEFGITLQVGPQPNAAQYIIYRSPTIHGPWTKEFAVPSYSTSSGYVGGLVATDPNNVVNCYRAEAVDASGAIVHSYKAFCIPKFVP